MKHFKNLFGMALAAIFAVCVLSSCEYVKGFFSSPSSVVEKFWKAVEEYDAKAAEKCLTDDEDYSKELKNSLKDAKKQKIKVSLKEIVGEEIDDEEATVECVVTVTVGKKKAGKGTVTATLVKEDGKWLIDNMVEADEFKDAYLKAWLPKSYDQPTAPPGAAAEPLVMATNAEFPPFEFIAADGSFQGIDIEIMQNICKALDRELVIEDIAFDAIIPAVVSGKADCGIAAMTITEDRKRNVDFTIPYYELWQVIVVSKGSSIRGMDDLMGKRIGAQLDTIADTLASDIMGADMSRFNTAADVILALTRNKVDAVVIDNETAKTFVARHPGKLVILEEPLTRESYSICVPKGDSALLRQLNGQLTRMMQDGTMEAILKKYGP